MNKEVCDECPIDLIVEDQSNSQQEQTTSINELPYRDFDLDSDFRNIPRSVQSKNGVISTRSSICTEMGADILNVFKNLKIK